ncbi:MAG TPA: 6-phosphogluconolactonase [Steroidobacteraceae bacterium]|nr:6-phosphogluconolactonase [Steroidobacteraceae bacterium]
MHGPTLCHSDAARRRARLAVRFFFSTTLDRSDTLKTVRTPDNIGSEPVVKRYPDRDALSHQVAADIAARLAHAIAIRGLASLVVSGGRTPVKLFEQLRTQAIDWSRVCVALADERWVPPTDADSNERLVREVLLQGKAAAARFLGLKNAAPSPDLGAVSAWETFARIPRPFDMTVLGMGDDGHTASLFPGSPNLRSALNPAAAAGCIGMWAPSAPQPRLSLNVSALLDSRRIVILIAGEAKWLIYMAASAAGAVEDMPVRAVLRQQRTPVEVCWAP